MPIHTALRFKAANVYNATKATLWPRTMSAPKWIYFAKRTPCKMVSAQVATQDTYYLVANAYWARTCTYLFAISRTRKENVSSATIDITLQRIPALLSHYYAMATISLQASVPHARQDTFSKTISAFSLHSELILDAHSTPILIALNVGSVTTCKISFVNKSIAIALILTIPKIFVTSVETLPHKELSVPDQAL
jgi:hypothetical protein